MSFFLTAAAIPVLALIIDLTFGDPPTAVHPVGWIGWWVTRFRSGVRGRNLRPAPFVQGLLFVLFSTVLVGGLIWLLQSACFFLLDLESVAGYLIAVFVLVVLLKGSLAFRSLIRAGLLVRAALVEGDLETARYHLSRNLVSRPVSDLSEDKIVSATVESLAENFVDSLVAPLFWYSILGLPGAWIYRFADTADSILGYRDQEREWLGKVSAKLDDILCWIPARLGGWFLVVSAALSGLDFRGAARVMLGDARKCSSPNSGWPMSAAAGGLNVRLEKIDTYVLNDTGVLPSAIHIDQIISVLRCGMILSTFFFAGIAGLLLPLIR